MLVDEWLRGGFVHLVLDFSYPLFDGFPFSFNGFVNRIYDNVTDGHHSPPTSLSHPICLSNSASSRLRSFSSSGSRPLCTGHHGLRISSGGSIEAVFTDDIRQVQSSFSSSQTAQYGIGSPMRDCMWS